MKKIYDLLVLNNNLKELDIKHIKEYISNFNLLLLNRGVEDQIYVSDDIDVTYFKDKRRDEILSIIDKYIMRLCFLNANLDLFKELIQLGARACKTDSIWYIANNLQNQLNSWLEYFLNRRNFPLKEIIFLIEQGADKKIVYKKIKDLIDNPNFEDFKFFVDNFKEEGINLEEIRKDNAWNTDNKLQRQLDSWLEEKCNVLWFCINEENIQFLLQQGADKEGALKIAVKEKHFESFKYLIEKENIKADLEKLRQDSAWNTDNKLQNQLDIWLEEKCNNKDIENIKFLLQQGADKEIVYKKIKNIIDNPNIYEFKFYIENFKKEGISLEKLRQDIEENKELKEKVCSMLLSNIKEETDFVVDQLSKIKEIKCKNEDAIKTLISSIYNKDNGLGTQTLENKIMRPEIFEEKTKELIIKIVKEINPSRANILRRLLKVKI